MTFNNFENNIDPQILERGYRYFKNGYVIEIDEVDTGLWEAEVEGTEVYNVSVRTDKFEIKDWECDCPYDMGSVCKHIAAVLYAIAASMKIEKDQPDNKHHTKKDNKKRIETIIKKVSREELQNFLLDQFKKERSLRNSFIAYFADMLDEEPNEKYRTIIRNLFKSSTDRSGFIDYRKASKFVNSLFELSSKAENILNKGNIPESMIICKTLIEEIPLFINDVERDDGGLGGVIDEAFATLSRISDKAPPMLKDELFEYCIDEFHKEKYHDYESADRFMDLLPDLVTTEEQEKKFFEHIDKQIEIEKRKEYSDYDIVRLVCAKLEYLKKNNLNSEVKKLLEKNIIYPEFRRIVVDEEIKKKNFARAKDLCLQGIKISENKNHYGTTGEWQEKILDIAGLENNVNDIRKWSELLFFNSHFDMKYYRKLKLTFNVSEWGDECEKIIEKIKKPDKQGNYYLAKSLAEIFIEEKYIERLLKLVQINSDHIEFIDAYAKCLKTKYPEEIISLYVEAIKKHAKITDVKVYYEVVNYMKNLGSVKGSEAKLSQLLNYFRGLYRNRRKMMELLNSNFP